jgi:hypothetical protein
LIEVLVGNVEIVYVAATAAMGLGNHLRTLGATVVNKLFVLWIGYKGNGRNHSASSDHLAYLWAVKHSDHFSQP